MSVDQVKESNGFTGNGFGGRPSKRDVTPVLTDSRAAARGDGIGGGGGGGAGGFNPSKQGSGGMLKAARKRAANVPAIFGASRVYTHAGIYCICACMYVYIYM